MDDETRREVDAWLGKARRDLDSARRLVAGVPPYRDTAAYHCQQAAEKAIKACLTASETPFTTCSCWWDSPRRPCRSWEAWQMEPSS
ncbi:MAG: HEPN domain-containing protein [Betaproteobacteria bacterium]|nr:HEPN domain-containing protein [Betaproteobacteria bacterium]